MKNIASLLLLAAFTLTAGPRAHAASSPSKMCVVSGEALDEDQVTVDYKGRTIKLCCKSCVKKFNANPQKYITSLDQETAKSKK